MACTAAESPAADGHAGQKGMGLIEDLAISDEGYLLDSTGYDM